jgi:hypothetical protein
MYFGRSRGTGAEAGEFAVPGTAVTPVGSVTGEFAVPGSAVTPIGNVTGEFAASRGVRDRSVTGSDPDADADIGVSAAAGARCSR